MQDAPIKEVLTDKGGFASRIWIRWLQVVSQVLGLAISESIRIVFVDSPYTVAAGVSLVCNTTAGAITVNFPEGLQGQVIRVVNSGALGNDATLVGGSALIAGAATKVLTDGEVYECRYDTTDGWR